MVRTLHLQHKVISSSHEGTKWEGPLLSFWMEELLFRFGGILPCKEKIIESSLKKTFNFIGEMLSPI